MQPIIIDNKQSSRTWIGVDGGLKLNQSSSQYGEFPHDRRYDCIDHTKNWTISLIVNPSQADVYGITYSLTKQQADGRGWMFTVLNTGYISFYWELAGHAGFDGARAHISSFNLNDNKFRVITISYIATGRVFSIYCNGLPLTVLPWTSGAAYDYSITANTTGPLCINKGIVYGIKYSSIVIKNIVIFNKSLSALEVDSLMNEIGIVPKPLHQYGVVHWTANQKYGKVLFDSVEQYNYAKITTNSFGVNGGWSYGSKPIADGETVSVTLPSFTSNLSKGLVLGINKFQTTVFDGTTSLHYLYFHQDTDTVHTIVESPTYTTSASISTQAATWKLKRTGLDLEVYKNNVLVYTYTGLFSINRYWTVGVYTAEQTSPELTFSDTTNKTTVGEKNGYFNVTDNKFYKTLKLASNHGELINYTDAEAGVTYGGGSTAWVNHYWKKPVSKLSRGFFGTASEDRVTTSIDHTSLIASDLTIEFWAKKENGTSGLAFALGQYGVNNKTLHVKFESSIITFRFWGNTVTFNCNYTTGWNHFVFYYTHATMTREVLMNLVSLGSNSAGPALDLGTGNSLVIGGWTNVTGEYFNGHIRNFRIWKGIRHPNLINAFKNRLIGSEQNLFVEFPLGETENGTISELVGTKTGTRAGTVTTPIEFTGIELPDIKNSIRTNGNGYIEKAISLGSVQKITFFMGFYLTASDLTKPQYYMALDPLFTLRDVSGTNYLYHDGYPFMPQAFQAGFNLLVCTIENGKGVDTTKTKITIHVNSKSGSSGDRANVDLSVITSVRFFREATYSNKGWGNFIFGGVSNNELNWADRNALFNNSLFESPSGKLKRTFKSFIPSITGSTSTKLTDYGTDGGEANLLGLSAAETTPTDPAYAVIPTYDIRLKDAPSTDLILDLDAREGITLAAGKISQWKSKVGSYIAYENDVNRQPTWEMSTGVPGVAFGISNSLVIDNFDLSMTGEIGILVFGKFNTSTGAKIVMEHGPNTNFNENNWLMAQEPVNAGPQVFYIAEKYSGASYLASTGNPGTGVISTNPTVMGAYLARTTNRNRGADYGTYRIGQAVPGTLAPATYGNLSLNIGNRSGGSAGMDGIINRILIYKSHAAYEQARRYLGLKHKSTI